MSLPTDIDDVRVAEDHVLTANQPAGSYVLAFVEGLTPECDPYPVGLLSEIDMRTFIGTCGLEDGWTRGPLAGRKTVEVSFLTVDVHAPDWVRPQLLERCLAEMRDRIR